jgi:N-acetylmuramoyl-L-alanine amidase
MRSCGDQKVIAAFSRTFIAVAICLTASTTFSQGSNAAKLLHEAEAREILLRTEIDTRKSGTPADPLLERVRTLVRAYEDISRLFPTGPYGDDALWHAGLLAADAFWEFGQVDERGAAMRLLKALSTKYPTSSLVKQVAPQLDRLTAAKTTIAEPPPPLVAKPTGVTLKAIRREALPGAMRVTLEFEGEAAFHDEEIVGPPRVFLDLQNTRPTEVLKDATQSFPDDVVRHIRVGRQLGTRTRVVLDLASAAPHTTYALYNPYRIVIDFARQAPVGPLAPVAPARDSAPVSRRDSATAPSGERPARPKPPRQNAAGGLSLSRQLGLGVARVVIDPGHGGHDPGAMTMGLSEADVVLDVALRLEALLLKQPGVEVVLTRRADVFVPLDERTALANREGADLFLSIHANASEDDRARGIETYFLNFAPSPAAEAVAARENAASSRTMRQLPDIVRAIALNNKIDESRDFASFVQASMIDRLKKSNKNIRDLGVKQAPFTVLVGATMPSILAEISFLTNQPEATLLRANAYRQQIAEALFNGVMKYQGSLKGAAQAVSSH